VSQTGAYLYLSPTSNNTGTFNIRYHGSNSTTWITLEHVTLPYQLGNLTCGTVYEWQAQLICTSTPGTTLSTVSPWSVAGTFTTLTCTVTPCNAPTGLSATNVSQTGANLYLTPTSNNIGTFNIRYHGANAIWTTIEHVTLPYQLGNLACGTTYEWQAQLICTNPITGAPITTVSPWSVAGTFTTLTCTVTPCNAPTGLSATNVSQTGATLYLSPTSSNAGTFNIRYHGANITTWTYLEHVTLPYQLGNLACGNTYEWQAQLICTNSPAAAPIITVSPWSAGGTFTTEACTTAPCGTPTGLLATDINQTNAILHWNAVPGAVAYIIRYKKANSATLEFTTVTAGTNVITLTSLTPGSYYIWQVQAVCSTTVGGLSPFSATATFATPSVIVFPNPASGFVNVSFWLNTALTTTILLRNSQGQVVYSLVILAQAGTNNLEIDISDLSVGLYFLSIQTKAYSIIKKVVINN
uniref:T9SS type A sorting domain-containing protein n=1 Tax=Flavobacterium sp. TaxID=239 RepID=UPI0025D75BE1